MTQLQAQLGSSPDALAVPASYPAGRDRVYLHRLFSALQSEYAANQPARDMLLRSLVSVLLVWLSRQVIHREAAGQLPERGREYLSRFSGLVEAQFRQHPSVEQLSHQVGISVAHLNSICREWAGQSALQMIHQRLLLEAKRNLIYTRMSVSRVADELGFQLATEWGVCLICSTRQAAVAYRARTALMASTAAHFLVLRIFMTQTSDCR